VWQASRAQWQLTGLRRIDAHWDPLRAMSGGITRGADDQHTASCKIICGRLPREILVSKANKILAGLVGRSKIYLTTLVEHENLVK